MQKLVSIIIPFLNEEDTLPELCRRLVAVIDAEPENFEVVLVDDGSTDASLDYLSQKVAADGRFRVISFSRNFGHQAAIAAGLFEARGQALILMDADLQDPPEIIPDFLQKWREGFEVVYAVRKSRAGESWIKKLLASLFYRVFHWLADTDMPMDAGDFRLLDIKAADALRSLDETHLYIRGLTAWIGFRQCPIFYERKARFAGESKYPLWKSAGLAWDAITSFSGKPLKLTINTGFIVAFTGVLYLLHVVYTRIMQPEKMVQGWTSLLAVILILGGIQIISLGLLGQYVERIFEQTKNRPRYIVRNRLENRGN